MFKRARSKLLLEPEKQTVYVHRGLTERRRPKRQPNLSRLEKYNKHVIRYQSDHGGSKEKAQDKQEVRLRQTKTMKKRKSSTKSKTSQQN
jgi:hypothetical protein